VGSGLGFPVVNRFVSAVLRVQFDVIDRSVLADVTKSRCPHAKNGFLSIVCVRGQNAKGVTERENWAMYYVTESTNTEGFLYLCTQ